MGKTSNFSRLRNLRTYVGAAVVVILPVLLYVAAWRLFPLQLNELSHRYDLWKNDVHEVSVEGLHGYERDFCTGQPSALGCTCVAMIHGLADSAMTWRYVLNAPMAAWPSPVKLYAFDLPGSGKSPPPADPAVYRARRQAEVMKKVLQPLCAHWTVVGNSFGGAVAAWLALDWSEGVTKLMLVDSAGLRASEIEREDARAFFVNPSEASLREFQRRAYASPHETPTFVLRAIADYMRRSNAREVLEAQTPEDELDGRLPTIRGKTVLVLWGEQDRVIPIEEGMKLRSLIPSSGWRQIKSCGHLPQKECPVPMIESLADLIKAGAA